LKRIFDVIVAAGLLLVLSPVMFFLTAIVFVNMGSPVLFRQKRPGLNARIFEMVKFRTMRDVLDANGKPLQDADRLTKLGKFMRDSSLDELPELWNVLKGDMSLVGPRPLLIEYLPRYSAEQARRHAVRPGVTGWAQVNGRNALSWNEKFEHDVWYVDNRSFGLDLKILWRTLLTVLQRKGISSDGHATMPPFRGSERVE
jgi:sugar transferase EpsL